MEFEVSYNLENEDQFWDGQRYAPPSRSNTCKAEATDTKGTELDDIVAADCREKHELIDNALRSYLSFTTNFKGMRSIA